MSRDYVLHPFRTPVHLQLDYQRELNAQQFDAVTAPPGPSLVIAGAGSGKTRILTYRVAYLLEQGIPPERLLLLTFTNKAAKEMMRRVADLLGQELNNLWGGTFHSVGSRILRQHAESLGYHRDFSILDREDSRSLIATCVAEAAIDIKGTRFPKPEVLADIYSLAMNTHRSIGEVLRAQYEYFHELEKAISDLRTRYIERKRAVNGMDFDDLLALWLRLLQEHDEIRELYQRRFQFVLVDEYQDTNHLQSDLVDLLVARHHNLTVVGDDAQSIYAWRGANYQNILRFAERYPDARIYKIETNYRSTPEILEVANAAIKANVHQHVKRLAAARGSGPKPVLVVCGDAGQQAAFVAQRVLELREEGLSMNHMAVLYRSHFHALELQLELSRRNIPFSITSGIRFFEQAHIKDVAAHLKLVVNRHDELSLKRILQLMPGVGPKAADRVWQAYAKTIDTLSSANPSRPTLATALQLCTAVIPKKAAVAWAQFLATVSQLEGPETGDQAAKMIRLVMEAGYEDHLKETYPNYRNRLEDLEQLAVFALQFASTEDFLTQLALLTNVEAEEGQPARSDDLEQLRLSTIHQAKGLEFEVVFLIMLCDGLLPSARAMESVDGEEEERRLMYVAVTRARNELYLAFPLIRAGFSGSGAALQSPSRFLSEIPESLLESWNLRPCDSYG